MANLIKRGSLLVVLLLFAFSSIAFAEPVTNTIAEEVGSIFLNAQDGIDRSIFDKRDAQEDAQGYESHSISTVTELKNDATGEILAYVFALEPKGFVVVSPDTDITPIIAYSFEGNFNWEDSANNALLGMLTQDMQNRLEALSATSEDLKNKNNELWDKYSSKDSAFLSDMTDSATYGPLLTTTWYQSSPYNGYCPMDGGSRSIVGCVATAMAQIVNYHACTSSVTFTSADNYTTITRAISITASSANMSGISYPASTDTAARLSYACGVSVEMDYTSTSSGASTAAVANALTSKFDFDSATAWAPQSGYYVPVLSTFYSKLQSNIQVSKPAQLSITDGTYGHSIVCDGYNSTTGQYHLNYGWGGSNPPTPWWYTLPAGMPSGYSIVKYGVLDIKSSTHPSCPDLYSWNGEEYVNNGYIYSKSHCPESESYQERLVTQPVEVAQYNDNMLNFKIKEVDDEISYINSLAMYYRNNNNEWTELDLLSAVHNSAGDVSGALKDKDDERVYTASGDEILLTYLAPYGGVEGAEFKSISSGYYLWSAETWCEVLELGSDINIRPGNTVTFSAKINNMSAYELPEDAVVYFNIIGPELYTEKVVSVPAAGLAPGSPEWFSCNWTVPADFPTGNTSYKASIYIGETNITWKAPPDESNDSDTSDDESEVTSVGSSCD